MQYLCLFYGSDNNMYRNYCLYVEDVSPTGPEGVLLTARPPCRSFCVQVNNIHNEIILHSHIHYIYTLQ